jgi:ribonuclease HII
MFLHAKASKGYSVTTMMIRSIEELKSAVRPGPPYSEELLEELHRDTRVGAQALWRRCQRALDKRAAEAARMESMLCFERGAREQGFSHVAGVDEAGRGPLAGPIVAAAVVLSHAVEELDDSKKLSEAQRKRLYDVLRDGEHDIGVARIGPKDIDRMGIQSANYRVMAEAAEALAQPADFLLVDGFMIQGIATPQERIIKGDQRSLSIAAASIVAKVERDNIMGDLERLYPGYGFAQHKGYGTKAHMASIAELGACPAHRKSFAPLNDVPNNPSLFDDKENLPA